MIQITLLLLSYICYNFRIKEGSMLHWRWCFLFISLEKKKIWIPLKLTKIRFNKGRATEDSDCICVRKSEDLQNRQHILMIILLGNSVVTCWDMISIQDINKAQLINLPDYRTLETYNAILLNGIILIYSRVFFFF